MKGVKTSGPGSIPLGIPYPSLTMVMHPASDDNHRPLTIGYQKRILSLPHAILKDLLRLSRHLKFVNGNVPMLFSQKFRWRSAGAKVSFESDCWEQREGSITMQSLLGPMAIL